MNDDHNLSESMAAGVEELRRVFEPRGFRYVAGASGTSSGGAFASGAFIAGDRKFEFSVRDGLGLVLYTVGAASISHEDYLRYAGVWGEHKYPNFGRCLAESFRALTHDLDAFFADFLSGHCVEFQRIVSERSANPGRFKGLSALNQKQP